MAEKEIDPEVGKYFDRAVQRSLEDVETRSTIDGLSKDGHDVSVDEIRAELIAWPARVLDRTRTMQEGWERARDRRDEILQEAVGQFRVAFSVRRFLLAFVLAALGVALLPPPIRWASLALLALPLRRSINAGLSALVLEIPDRSAELARERFLASLEAQVTIAVREITNRRLTSFETTFDIFDRRGLRQLADPDREVSTKADAELDGLLASLDSGSVGLAGPRGCGKSTLIRSFTEGRSMPFNKERIGLNVAAPVKYDPREFILHLFASLCEEVLANRPRALAQAGTRVAGVADRRQLWILGLGALILGAAGTAILLDFQAPSHHTIGVALSVVGGVLGVIWVMIWTDQTRLGRAFGHILPLWFAGTLSEVNRTFAPEDAAKDYLKQIRFQQSQEAGGSAELSLPVLGLGLGGSSATTLARTPWTLPEAVEEFRRFASTLSQRFVVIGIDELDKMESDIAAREFLNNVKGVFGVEGCYFLVSVSEDAMSAFERRGLPVRDVFDSSFDEIQRIGYLDLAESRGVLESRVTGVPVPFQCLCHCLAGGLPRDLIRTTRELVYHYDAEQARGKAANASLGNLAQALVRTEWQGKVAGAITVGRSTEHPWWLTTWLHEMDQGEPDAPALRAWTTRLSRDPVAGWHDLGKDDAAEARRVATEMMTFNYYAATLLEVFADHGLASRIEDSARQGELDEGTVAKLETLAMARQQFAIDPRLAWKLVEQTRLAADLEPW